jgi:uncharacterized protein HemX
VRKQLIAAVLTLIGGVAVYWLTNGLQERRERQEQQQEEQRQHEDQLRRDEKVAKQRQQEEERAQAERKRREDEERARRPKMSDLEMNINRNGSDYKDFVASSIEECLNTCAQEAKCLAITFTKSSRQCWMKSAVPLRADDARYISAVKIGG